MKSPVRAKENYVTAEFSFALTGLDQFGAYPRLAPWAAFFRPLCGLSLLWRQRIFLSSTAFTSISYRLFPSPILFNFLKQDNFAS